MSTSKEKQLRRTVIEQAVDWYRRHRDAELGAGDRDAFLAWLRASPQNTHEYLAIAELWGGLKEAVTDLRWNEAELVKAMAEGRNAHIVAMARPVERRKEVVPRVRRLGLVAATVLVALAALYQFGPAHLVGRPVAYSAGSDKPDRMVLEDGSVMYLNMQARVKVRYSSARRSIELDRGQAFFDVAPDAHRPFTVRTGDTDVTAVGTRFDVNRHAASDLTVTVIQGRVDLRSGADAAGGRLIRLREGQQVHVDGAAHSPAVTADLRAATAWMRQERVFDDYPLAAVVEQFNHYLEKPMQIVDPPLRDLRISGVFDLYDGQTFLALLRQQGIEVRQQGGVMELSLKK